MLREGKSVYDEKEWIAGEIGVSVNVIMAMDLQLGKNSIGTLDEPPGRIKSSSKDKILAEILPAQDAPLASATPDTDPIFKKHLAKFLSKYSERDKDIFLKYYFSSITFTDVELAHTHGISNARVGQIKRKMVAALKKYVRQFDLRLRK